MKFRDILKPSAASFLASNVVFPLTFLGNIALMRMLLPEDFGTLAFASSLVGVIQIFTSFVLSAVFIQQKSNSSLVRTVFQLSLAVALLKLLLGALLFFFSQSRYDALIWRLFVLILLSKVFSLFGPLLTAQLEKRGCFLRSTLVTSGATLFSILAAVVSVACGAGVYGLVVREVLPAIVTFAIMVMLHPDFLPRRLFHVNRRQLRAVAVASAQLYFQRGAELVYLRIPLLIIEAFFGASVLGLYTQATYLVTLVDRSMGIVNQQVAFVFFSHNRRNAQETRTGLTWLLFANLLLAVPVAVLLILFPRQLILFLWSDNWAGAIDYLRTMAPMVLLLPLFSVLKSRLLGLRFNQAITIIYCVGVIFLMCGLWLFRGVSDPGDWLAGLTVASYMLMVGLLVGVLWLGAKKYPHYSS